MFGIFGQKADDTPTTQESIQKFLDMEELLMKKQAFLERKIKEEVATAMKNGSQNKRLALQALNRKRQHQKGLEHVDNILSNIESQRYALENASMNADMLKVMTNASKALKAANNNVDADNPRLYRVLWDSQIDDNELLAELEEELDKQLLDIHPIVSLPDVPFREIPTPAKTKTKDHEDLDALANWAMN